MQQQWLEDRPVALSGFEYLESYELQAALNEEPDSRAASFYIRENPHYYALGQGRCWLPEIGASTGTHSTGHTNLALPLREGTFRLQANFIGDSLKLQQQRAAGFGQTQFTFALRPLTDSLVQHYGRNHAGIVNLPAPAELRAHAGRLRLHLFFSNLSRDGAGPSTRYLYSAQGELRIEP